MKKKNIIKTGLLSAALLLGTGYAVVTSNIVNINGNIRVQDTEADVAIWIESGDFDYTQNGDTITITMKEGTKFKDVGDSLTIPISIGQNPNEDAMVSELTYTITNTDYFEISGPATVNNECGGMNTAEVTLRLKKLPLTDEESTCEISIKIVTSVVAKVCQQ